MADSRPTDAHPLPVRGGAGGASGSGDPGTDASPPLTVRTPGVGLARRNPGTHTPAGLRAGGSEAGHEQVAEIELAYLDTRDLLDDIEIASARGDLPDGFAGPTPDIAVAALANALSACPPDEELDPADAAAVAAMRAWVAANDERSGDKRAGDHEDDDEDDEDGDDEDEEESARLGFTALSERIESEYADAQNAVDVSAAGTRSPLTRLGVLEALSIEPDPATRQALFAALAPVWHTIDDGGTDTPYRRLLELSVPRWAAGLSPVARNAAALGLDLADIEPSLIAILETWRDANVTGQRPIEPWDWWYEAGAAARALRDAIPLHTLRRISDAYHASLGADPVALGVCYDVFPRAGRPPVPVAYTEFGRRPRTGRNGEFSRAQPWVMGTYTAGGLGELTELIHETGHAIHIAAIRTRPAFADWPDSDAFTEALGELTALDTAEPDWQRHWLGASAPSAAVSLRGRYADVMLDICWALLEIRMHAAPWRRPNDVWTELTSGYLGVVPHPELSWWAMRGQLVQEPGYMVNYALGPILAADMRAAIRAVRGDWTAGDPGWYAWVSEHVYRFGLERSSARVLSGLLGREPRPDALIAEIKRGASRN